MYREKEREGARGKTWRVDRLSSKLISAGLMAASITVFALPVKRDLLVSKQTYYCVKRDLLQYLFIRR